jgi:hypothetical protein
LSSFLTHSRPAPPGKDWEYFTLLSSIHSEFVDHGNGTFELVVVDGPEHTPRVFNTRWGDKNAFATGDLLVPHPTKTGFWKVFGRVDDQLVLSNGEKVNRTFVEDPVLVERLLSDESRAAR